MHWPTIPTNDGPSTNTNNGTNNAAKNMNADGVIAKNDANANNDYSAN